MKFSVLMSVYKRENPDFLHVALKSLLEQTVLASEVVIVQDGPLPDGLLKVLDEFRDKLNIRDVYNEKNLGLGWSLKKGLENCSYEWAFRMDSDDIACPDRFEKQVRVIEEMPELDVVGGWYEEFNAEPGDLSSFRNVPETHEEIYQGMKRYASVNHVTVAIKKSSVQSVGSYRGGTAFQEDYDLWIRMIMQGAKFYNIQTNLVFVRVGDGMLGRRGGWRYLMNEIDVQKMAFSLGLIGVKDLVRNVLIRIPTRLLPQGMRSKIYSLARNFINKR